MPTPAAGRPPQRRAEGRRSAPAESGTPQLRETILAATTDLLAKRSFSELSVQDILAAAGISRGSFYFYFDSKHDVLAELVRRAVSGGHDAAEPWLTDPPDKVAALRAGISAGARLWRTNAPILRAIVENWRTDPRLNALWLDQMRGFTDATIAQIRSDPHSTARLAGLDIPSVASTLTWLGERVYYLAALGTPPFDNEDTLVDTLLHIWTSTLYGEPPGGDS
jgi:AcrR family transcriptional regulator